MIVLAMLIVAAVGQPQSADGAARPATFTTTLTPERESIAIQTGMILRCPVCQGMPIAESPSQMAQDMMLKVRELVAEGKTQPEILEYFTGRYGEWVLLAPKAEGFNLTLWWLPVVVLIVGLWLTVLWLRRQARTARHAGAQPSAATPAPKQPSVTDDEYLHALRDEVSQ